MCIRDSPSGVGNAAADMKAFYESPKPSDALQEIEVTAKKKVTAADISEKLDPIQGALGRTGKAKFNTLENQIKDALGKGGDELGLKILSSLEDGSISLSDALSMGFDLLKGVVGSGEAGGMLTSFMGLFGRYGGIFESYGGGGIARGRQAGYPAVLHGTEAVVPLPNNNKIPVDLNGAGSQQNNVTVNVNMETGTATTSTQGQDPNQGTNLGNAVAAAVQAELQNQKRSGGILNPYGVS